MLESGRPVQPVVVAVAVVAAARLAPGLVLAPTVCGLVLASGSAGMLVRQAHLPDLWSHSLCVVLHMGLKA